MHEVRERLGTGSVDKGLEELRGEWDLEVLMGGLVVEVRKGARSGECGAAGAGE